MCFFFSLMPATILTVIGYFVLFSSMKIEGGVHLFGRALAVWVFLIAVAIPIMGAVVTFSGLCPLNEILQLIHSGAGS